MSETDRTIDAVGAPDIEDGVAALGARLHDRDNLVAEAHPQCVAGVG